MTQKTEQLQRRRHLKNCVKIYLYVIGFMLLLAAADIIDYLFSL